jgi:hypothetical protein
MSQKVAMSAMLKCSFGMAPSSLMVVVPLVATESMPAANINDHIPMTNILPFGMCQSLANPTVAAATAAALGVLTPMPCIPVTSAPWAPGSPTVMLRGAPALNKDSICNCNWGGVIQITSPGTTKEMIA